MSQGRRQCARTRKGRGQRAPSGRGGGSWMGILPPHRDGERRTCALAALQPDRYSQSIRDQIRLAAYRVEENVARTVLLNASLTQVASFPVGMILGAKVERQRMPASATQRDVQAAAG